jgi:hypothetical protein
LQERDATITAIERSPGKDSRPGGQLARNKTLAGQRASRGTANRAQREGPIAGGTAVKLEAQEADHHAETEVLKEQLATAVFAGK